VPKADNITTILGHCHVIWEQLPGAPWAPSAFEIWELQLPGNPNVCPGIALPSLHTKVVPKAMSNVFFFACKPGTAEEGEYVGRWNQLLCYP